MIMNERKRDFIELSFGYRFNPRIVGWVRAFENAAALVGWVSASRGKHEH
jgi:hypothetical protein